MLHENIPKYVLSTPDFDKLYKRRDEIGKATIGASQESKEKAQMVVSQDIKAHELEENQREGVSIDGE